MMDLEEEFHLERKCEMESMGALTCLDLDNITLLKIKVRPFLLEYVTR